MNWHLVFLSQKYTEGGVKKVERVRGEDPIGQGACLDRCQGKGINLTLGLSASPFLYLSPNDLY